MTMIMIIFVKLFLFSQDADSGRRNAADFEAEAARQARVRATHRRELLDELGLQFTWSYEAERVAADHPATTVITTTGQRLYTANGTLWWATGEDHPATTSEQQLNTDNRPVWWDMGTRASVALEPSVPLTGEDGHWGILPHQ